MSRLTKGGGSGYVVSAAEWSDENGITTPIGLADFILIARGLFLTTLR